MVVVKETLPAEIAGTQKIKKEEPSKPLDSVIRPLAEIEKEVICEAIKLCNGNVIKAAVYLEVAPSTLYRKIKKWEE